MSDQSDIGPLFDSDYVKLFRFRVGVFEQLTTCGMDRDTATRIASVARPGADAGAPDAEFVIKLDEGEEHLR